MVTREQAQKRAEELAAPLAQMSHEELGQLAQTRPENPDALCRFEELADGELYVDTTIARFGRFRKRVSVEITVTADGWEQWGQPGCVYFERFASGDGPKARPFARHNFAVFCGLLLLGLALCLGLLLHFCAQRQPPG